MTFNRRSLVVLFTALWLLCSYQPTNAIAHGPRRPHPSADETTPRVRAQRLAENALNPRARSARRQVQLGGLTSGLRQLAQRVVTELNDDVNGLNQLTGAISRQRILQARDLDAGYGMRRWTPDVFEQKVDMAHGKASNLIEEYRQIMPWVTVVISEDGLDMDAAADQFECLAGRTEYVAVEVANCTRRTRRFSVSGDVAGKPGVPSAGTVAPLSSAYAFAQVAKQKAGTVELSLTCAVGKEALTKKWPVLVKPSHELTLRIVNAATGAPCAARAFIRGSDGRYWIAGQRPVILAGERNILKFGYADGTVKAVLPPGEIQLKIQKGFEYLVTEQTELISHDKTVTMSLERWVDMPAKGWYSGDTHVHWVRHTWYENEDPEWLNVHSRAEDLWVNNNLILKHWWKNVISEQFPRGLVANRPDTFPVGKVEPMSVNGRIVWTGEEYRNDEVFGHMCFLRINRLIEPVSTGFMGGPEAVHFPPNSYTYDEVHDAGGIVIAAHDVVMEVPIQAILGKLDVLDAHNTNRYYDLLNCGFRIPLSIGSDYPANLMGFARVYVYCGQELEYDSWIDHLAAGRTFVSSGAVISLTADGAEIGDTIHVRPGEAREIVVNGEARCKNAIQRVEIVHNGGVVKTIRAEGNGTKIEFSERISVQGPGWIAARTFPATSRTWWGQADVAHTSPIYIASGDARLVRPAAVRNLVRVLQAGRGAAQASRMYTSGEQKQAVLDYYDGGIAMFEDLLSPVHRRQEVRIRKVNP